MSKVTVVGAGKYGSTTVQRLAEADVIDEVVMIDIVEGLPQGLALDMNQSRSVLGYRTLVTGTNDYADTAGSDVVVITAGLPRKPGMSRMDLLGVNAKIVKTVTEEIAAYSPDCVIIVVTNPLDQMTTLAADVSGFPKERVMGQAGMLDSARLAHFIAEKLDIDVMSVKAVTLGSHGPTMVPVPSLCEIDGSRWLKSSTQKPLRSSSTGPGVAERRSLPTSRPVRLTTHPRLRRLPWLRPLSPTAVLKCPSVLG